MPLNLNEYKPQEEEITFGDQKFIASAEIDDELFERMENANSLSWKDLCNLYIDILSLKNEKKDVVKFFNSLKIPAKKKVMTFIINYFRLAGESEEKKN